MIELTLSSNFLVQTVVSGSLMQLWGLIRALQLLILQTLMNINYPPHVEWFFSACVELQNLDIFGGEDIIAEHMTFKETQPYN
jgi:hypothetical protein